MKPFIMLFIISATTVVIAKLTGVLTMPWVG
jgi:hypothetical protein